MDSFKAFLGGAYLGFAVPNMVAMWIMPFPHVENIAMASALIVGLVALYLFSAKEDDADK